MISKMLARRIFIAVNNPWVCSINDDPVKICYDMDYILGEQTLTDRLALKTDFVADGRYGIFPYYRISIHLEAIGTKTAIDLGEIIKADVRDMVLHLIIKSDHSSFTVSLPTECEDLDADKYLTRRNDFEIRNVMSIESNSDIQ